MRSKIMLRKSRLGYVAAGALILAIPGSAVALATSQAAPQGAIQATLDARHLEYGGKVLVSGKASPADAGQKLSLEFAPAGGSSWRALSSSVVHRDGSFRLIAPLRRSGLVRVAAAGVSRTPRTSAPTGTSGSGKLAPSAPKRVSVAAAFRVPRASLDVLGGRPAHVRGKLMPAVAGRRVTLLGRSGSGWHALVSTRTGPRGGFDLRYNASNTGHQWLGVRFVGDRLNTRSWAHAGQVTAFRQSGASWYNDAGSTACGFHAQFGVANRDLPCGTKVTFYYGGRTVNAIVDDRGPYVGGRDWDLNQNTAGALGFGGVDTVWSSI